MKKCASGLVTHRQGEWHVGACVFTRSPDSAEKTPSAGLGLRLAVLFVKQQWSRLPRVRAVRVMEVESAESSDDIGAVSAPLRRPFPLAAFCPRRFLSRKPRWRDRSLWPSRKFSKSQNGVRD